MNEYTNNIEENNWGFYVDIEKENYEKIHYQQPKPTLITNTCNYYEQINKHNATNLLIKVSTITLVSICVTYLVIFIL